MTLFVHCVRRLKVTAHFTSLVGGEHSLATRITFPSARLPVKIPFSHTVMVQCAELGDISGPLHGGGGERRHAYASLLETIISARSIVRPTAWLAECAASIGGPGLGVCVDSCTTASPSSWGEWLHAASDTPLLTCSEMQFLRRTGGWMLSSSGGCSCRQHTDEAAEPVSPSGAWYTWFYLFWLRKIDSQTCPEMSREPRPMRLE